MCVYVCLCVWASRLDRADVHKRRHFRGELQRLGVEHEVKHTGADLRDHGSVGSES